MVCCLLMMVDGKKIAESVYAEMRERISVRARAPRFVIITCAPNFETRKYLSLKQRRAKEVGIVTEVIELPETSSTLDVTAEIRESSPHADGLIVQLPLPASVDRDAVVRAVPPQIDVDALNPVTEGMLSPVIGAVREILRTYGVSPLGKRVTVIGSGKLVGFPGYLWFTKEGARVHMVTKETADIGAYTKHADIILCGTGVPALLSPDMVKEGVIILDAGTSEDGGELHGDADPRCAEKASLFTPVPGGIGPVTIAMLLRNVVDCAEAGPDMI